MALDLAPIGRALISVSDKTGLVELGQALAARGVELVSTGGTAAALAKAGLAVIDVAQLTGFPEMMDGRLKTLHPRVHGGLLAIRDEPAHQAAMIANNIPPIDLLVVNLYPFEDALRARRRLRRHDREHRHRRPGDDPRRRQEPRRRRRDRRRRRLRCAARRAGRATTARRRSPSVARWRRRPTRAPRPTTRRSPTGSRARSARTPPAWRAFGGKLRQRLRYGENPHQSAAFYVGAGAPPRRRHRAAVAGQGALLQQYQRHRRRLRSVAEFDPEDPRRSRSSSTPTPAASRSARASPRPMRRRSPAIPFRPSAASSRSTASSTRRRRARSSRSSPRSSSPPTPTTRRWRSSRRKKNLRLLLAGALPDPRAADARRCARSPAACWCRTATTARSTRRR